MSPSPFRFYKGWLLNKDGCRVIERYLSNNYQQGWVGFIISSKLRKIKSDFKAWLADFEKKGKQQDEFLLKETEKWDLAAENADSPSIEMDVRTSLKADLLSLYQPHERNLM